MSRSLLLFWALAAAASAQPRRVPAQKPARIDLATNWRIQSSDGSHTLPTTVPSAVVGAMVANGLYPDPYFGLNLRSIPGTTYDFGDNFAVDPMPADSPFRSPWWYRTEFTLGRPPATPHRYWLNFDSINYRANIWLNGRQIADSDAVRGMYRSFEFDVTGLVSPGVNSLEVEVFAPTETDLSISFVDWNPLPADKNMGLVGDVYLLVTGPVAVRHPQVRSKGPDLTLAADVVNAGDTAVDGELTWTIEDRVVTSPLRLAPGETRRATQQTSLDPPRLWWPNGVGEQNLYAAKVEFRANNAVSDVKTLQFGIRTVTSELDSNGHRVFRINGQKILIRGAAWTPDMFLRKDPGREEIDLRYAREMNLNAIRLEGKFEMTDAFFDAADRNGILILAGWCCCSGWEMWDQWQSLDYTTAAESLRTQLRRLRNHPSMLAFLYGSDNVPPPAAEQAYLRVFAEENWPNPTIAGAIDAVTPGGGRTGVKMTGPYDYVPPAFWLADREHGGAWGFNTETSPGPAIPELASLRQMMPEADLWPTDNTTWNFHAGSGSFADTRVFNAAIDGRYGPARDVPDYNRKAQAMTYEAQRAMFEAYGRNKYAPATGVIQWMLNNAWPGLIWHLYDWYLRPGGGYFGTKKACEPIHVQYSYDDASIVVVNARYESLPGYTVTAKVYNLDLTEKGLFTATVDIAPDSTARVFRLPEIDGLSRTYFLRLTLADTAGQVVSSNFYWLSTQPDVMDWPNFNYRYVPITSYMDLTGLDSLPRVKLDVTWESTTNGDEQTDRVLVRNPSDHLAFLVHLTVLKGKAGTDVAPVYWSDNYIELFPGEQREVTAVYPRRLLEGAPSFIHVDGWNASGPE
jgi:exo-1,4-beta-D-glucosaminidase